MRALLTFPGGTERVIEIESGILYPDPGSQIRIGSDIWFVQCCYSRVVDYADGTSWLTPAFSLGKKL